MKRFDIYDLLDWAIVLLDAVIIWVIILLVAVIIAAILFL